MRAVECSWTDQIFSFFSDDGCEYHWNATRAMEDVVAGSIDPHGLVRAPISESIYKHICEKNGIEENHIPTLSKDRLEEPILLVEFPDNTHVVVDGNHRMVARYRRGGRSVKAVVLTLAQLDPYNLTDLRDCIIRHTAINCRRSL